MSNSRYTFNGFEQANTTPVPDVLFDQLLPYLNEAQLKVMLYIVRRTAGFKKTEDAISLKQFRYGITTRDGKQLDGGCGLKNMTSIIKALNDLEQMGCIESEKRESAEGDAATTLYRVRFVGTTRNGVPTTRKVVPTLSNGVGVLRETEDGTTRNGVGVLRETESQETVLQQTDSQETVLQGDTSDAEASACASPADVALSEIALEEDTPTEKAVAVVAQPPMQQQIAPAKRESAKQQKPSSRLSGGVQSTDVVSRQAARAPGLAYSPEASAIMDLWDSTFSRSQPRTPANCEAAAQLVASNPTAEELSTCRKWLFTTDDPKRPWFRKKGVALADVAKNFSNWQSLQDAAPRKPKEEEEDPYSWDAIMRRQREREAEEALV